jgi:hypothetical protein
LEPLVTDLQELKRRNAWYVECHRECESKKMRSIRQHSRVKAVLPIEVRPLDAPPLYAETAEICMGGCYVEMMLTQPVAAHVWVTIWMGEQKMVAMGEVVSCHPHVGNGLRFTSISREDSEKLRQLVDSLLKGNGLERAPVHQAD